MLIPDHETAVDYLNYEAIAKTIVELLNENREYALTIGIHGDWEPENRASSRWSNSRWPATRLEQQRRREEEEARIRALNDVLSAWREARDIRMYIAEARAALQADGAAPDDELQAWLAWAEGYAARLDPFVPQPTVPEDPGPPRRTYGW